MKAVKLADFRIPARHIAGLEWGTVNTSYRTNRHGAYYYSCSGHGGYVVDSRCLTPKERRCLDRYTEPQTLRILVQQRNGGGGVVIGVNCAYFQSCGPIRHKRYSYAPMLGPVEFREIPVYVFEEDCDWAILEKLTDIRTLDILDEKQHQRSINRTFREWIKPRKKRINGLPRM